MYFSILVYENNNITGTENVIKTFIHFDIFLGRVKRKISLHIYDSHMMMSKAPHIYNDKCTSHKDKSTPHNDKSTS